MQSRGFEYGEGADMRQLSKCTTDLLELLLVHVPQAWLGGGKGRLDQGNHAYVCDAKANIPDTRSGWMTPCEPEE